jgi:hypothetical protein
MHAAVVEAAVARPFPEVSSFLWVRIQKELISYLMHKNEEIRGKRLGQM